MVELPTPDSTPAAERRALRLVAERERFDPEHFACDIADEDSMVAEALRAEVWWTHENAGAEGNKDGAGSAHCAREDAAAGSLAEHLASVSLEGARVASGTRDTSGVGSDACKVGGDGAVDRGGRSDGVKVHLTEWEREALTRLPRRTPLVDERERPATYLGLVDLCYAYSHEYRVCGGEFTAESATTAAQLSASLAWLERWESVREVAEACVRRALCFPLLRSWPLAVCCLRDTAAVLRCGRRGVLRCLLKLRHLMERADEKHLLNRLFLDQYCVWVQGIKCVAAPS